MNRNCLTISFTANAKKVVLPKAQTANYEHAKDNGLSLIFTIKFGTISLKHIGNLLRKIHLLQR